MRIDPGGLDRYARHLHLKNDDELAASLGVTKQDLEDIRYGRRLNLETAVSLANKLFQYIPAA